MYNKPTINNWNGRIDSETNVSSFRIHQKVQLTEPAQLTPQSNAVGLIGFMSDEGVRRNKGRVGAANAPAEIKKALAKLPWHLSESAMLFDNGDVACENGQLEIAQEELSNTIFQLYDHNITPIILGGGHETLFGHYLGARKFIGHKPSLGIINIDAHFDLRPYNEGPSSGTMFRQILDQDANADYLCIGIQRQGNTKELFETAEAYNCQYIEEESVSLANMDTLLAELDVFIEQHDYVIMTLCTDAISSNYAPGVSAPSPFGLDPKTVRRLIQHVVANKKTLSFDISEVNPSLDTEKKTVSLAAYFIHEALLHFHKETRGG